MLGTSGMSEMTETEIILKDVSAVGLKCIMDFIYSGRIQICLQNINSLLQTASYVQVPEVLDFCNVSIDLLLKNVLVCDILIK